VFQI